MVRAIRHTITASLMKQRFDDVLEEFFNLEKILSECDKDHVKNYVTIRLVTIIEQFFRKIVEAEISKGNTRGIPKELTIQTQDLDKLNELTKTILISTSYTFQSVNAIKQSMNEYGVLGLFDDATLEKKISALMSSRHDTVHTVIPSTYDQLILKLSSTSKLMPSKQTQDNCHSFSRILF